jgi:hypothetical protein
MSASVPLIGNPRDQLLEALPFVHARARDQCYRAIRRAFDVTAEEANMQIMLSFATPNGPALLDMVATVVRTESNDFAILTGREVDPGLAGLLQNKSESAADNDVDTNRVELNSQTINSVVLSSETDVSSITLPSFPSLLQVGGVVSDSGSARSYSAADEPTESHRAGTASILSSAASRSADEEPIVSQRGTGWQHHGSEQENTVMMNYSYQHLPC